MAQKTIGQLTDGGAATGADLIETERSGASLRLTLGAVRDWLAGLFLRFDAAQALSGGQQAQARTNLGLGTAATQNTGTSGAAVPLLSAANAWGAAQTGPGWHTVRSGNGTGSLALLTVADTTASGFGFAALKAQASAYAEFAGSAKVRAGVMGVAAYPNGPANDYLSVGLYGFVPTGGHGPAAVAGLFERPDQTMQVIVGGAHAATHAAYALEVYDTNAGAVKASISPAGAMALAATLQIGSYTVAGLPAGAAGMTAWASNGRAPTGSTGATNITVEAAGAGTGCFVTHNGSAWKIAGTNVTVQA